MWDNSKWSCNSTKINQNWISVNLESKEDGTMVRIYNIYSLNHYREKEACWNTLATNIEEDQDNNLILAGDLNLVLHANEKRGRIFGADPFKDRLEHIIQEQELVDIKPKNRMYTWSNRRLGAGNIMERLDHFLINITYLSSFATGQSNILNNSASDHYPITLTLLRHCQLDPLPFKYCSLWNQIPEARNAVWQAWTQHVEGSPTFIWETKMKRTRQALKNWAKTKFQEPELRKKHIKKDLEELQQKIEAFGLTNEGNNYTTQDTIKEAATNHFKNLLTKDKSEEDYSTLLQYMPKEVTQETNSRLTHEVEEEEVQKAIWSLHPDKVPGPDGFPISFYKEYWQMIKKDLLKMIRWALRKGKLGGYTNSTYLALIPKENRPSTFSRFRPISLCNSAYKIITKILSSRLKPHLSSLISENQGGFLPNRHITDSILLVQEAIHSSISRKEKGFVLKLDLANAFDRVRHTFLFAVLHKMGFDPSFTNMIKACISNPCISPLINDRPCAAFQSSRGLRQGCPLSPYLFILMAESLSKALDFNRRTGLITGIKIEQGTKNINHSQFADDTLLMGGASITIARCFKKILNQFMEYSGGKINQVKSCIYKWNVSNLTIHSIASTLEVSYKLNWSHFTYLGMPVSMGPLKADTWNEILDKIQRKI
eukprot:PITA_10445